MSIQPEFIVGHVLDVLPTFEDDSIDLVPTSPPYWGARDYGEEANAIWGGDDDCEHEWGEECKGHEHERHDTSDPTSTDFGGWKDWDGATGSGAGKFCQKCGAWFGQFGLEPTWQMYVEHLLVISREIKRVLKPTGSYYLVLGDTYAGSGCGYGSNADPKHPNVRRGKIKPRQHSYDSITKPKQKLDIPGKVITALQEDDWVLRNKIIWYKPDHMPEPAKDRLTKSYEEILFLVKKAKGYHFNLDAIREPHKRVDDKGKNPGGVFRTRIEDSHLSSEQKQMALDELVKLESMGVINIDARLKIEGTAKSLFGDSPEISGRAKELQTKGYFFHYNNPKGKNPGDCWFINTQSFPEAHYAVFPEALLEPIMKSSCPQDGIVLDPFVGTGTTCFMAINLRRRSIGIDISEKYIEMAKKRCGMAGRYVRDFEPADSYW